MSIERTIVFTPIRLDGIEPHLRVFGLVEMDHGLFTRAIIMSEDEALAVRDQMNEKLAAKTERAGHDEQDRSDQRQP